MKIAAVSIADYCEATEGVPHDVERLYFRMILKMFSREGPLPDDDADNARIFGYRDVRTYKSLKKKLLAWPKTVYVKNGFIRNDRVEKDLIEYRVKLQKAVEDGRIGGQSKRDRRKNGGSSPEDRSEIGSTSDEDQPGIDTRSDADLPSIADAINNKNNDLGQATPSPTPSTDINTPLHQDAARSGVSQNGICEGSKTRPAVIPKFVSEDALRRARKQFPGWDAQAFLAAFRTAGMEQTARDPDAAFLGFMRKRTKGKSPYGDAVPELAEEDAP